MCLESCICLLVLLMPQALIGKSKGPGSCRQIELWGVLEVVELVPTRVAQLEDSFLDGDSGWLKRSE